MFIGDHHTQLASAILSCSDMEPMQPEAGSTEKSSDDLTEQSDEGS